LCFYFNFFPFLFVCVMRFFVVVVVVVVGVSQRD